MAYRQGTFSLIFFIGTIIVAMVQLPGILEVSGTSTMIDTGNSWVPTISQNFHSDTNRYINKQIIPQHMKASYQYLAMASYFDRSDVALPGFSKYCRLLSYKELENANFFMNYINKRGGEITFRAIEAPDAVRWSNGLDVMFDILETEKSNNEKLRRLHDKASKDPHMTHVIEDRFLDRSVKLIKEIGDHIANLERMVATDTYSIGEFVFDKDL
ncbi:hypothetical protein ACF0H5_009003 [Mactra antiquata]